MRNLFIALLFSFYSYGQQYTVVQINARWNISNDVKLNLPSNVKYKYAYLEEQKESMRQSLKAVPVNFSDFREASVTTGCIVTVSETYSQYSTNNNGCVRAYLDCNTIVTDSNDEKTYSFCIEGGGFVEKIEDINSPNTNCRCYCRTGINGGSICHVKMRDGLNDDTTVISYSVCVGYNDASRTYNCIQRSNST